MNREEAKVILACTHWEQGADSYSSDEVEAAFQLLEEDSELQTWFEQEQAFDEAIASKIQEAECPPQLQETLHRFIEKAERKQRRSSVIRRIAFPLAAAAAIVIGLLAYKITQPFDFQQVKTAQTFAAFRSDMSDFANSLFLLQHSDPTFAALNDRLGEGGAPQYVVLPSQVEAMEAKGCSVLQWGPTKASLLCFATGEGNIVHIFMIPRDQLTEGPEAGSPAVLANGLETATWERDGLVYMLCGSKPGISVSKFVPGANVAATDYSLPDSAIHWASFSSRESVSANSR